MSIATLEPRPVTQIEVIRPLVAADRAVEIFNEYQSLKGKLASEGDFREYTDSGGRKRQMPTKQWRTKLTRFFGIDVRISEERIEQLEDGSFVVYAKARAEHPNGLFMESDGTCWSKTKERYKDGKPIGDLYHNTRSHAITRAKNRAVLELVGFGEVSDEEIGEEEVGHKPNGTPGVASSSQKNYIIGLLTKPTDKGGKGLSKEDVVTLVEHSFGTDDVGNLTREQASTFIEQIKKTAPEAFVDLVSALKRGS
jgi:hypothetical protein